MLSFTPIDEYFVEKIRGRCLNLLTNTNNKEYFLVLTGLLEVLNFEYNKSFVDFNSESIINYEPKILERKLYEIIFDKIWEDDQADIVHIKDGIKALQYSENGKVLRIIPYLVSNENDNRDNVGNRGYAGKLRDDNDIRTDNTCIIVFDVNPIDTLITASDKKIIDRIFEKTSLINDFLDVNLPNWYNELVRYFFYDKTIHSMNVIQRLEILYKIKKDNCSKKINEYIGQLKMPLFYLDDNIVDIKDNYNLFCDINSNKIERVTSNFIKDVADKLNMSYLPNHINEDDFYDVLRKDNLHLSSIYDDKCLTFKVMYNVFYSTNTTKISNVLVKPNNDSYYKLHKTKKEIHGILNKGNLKKIEFVLEGNISTDSKLYIHYYFNNLKKQSIIKAFVNKSCEIYLNDLDGFQVINIVINESNQSITKALFNGKFMLQKPSDKIVFPELGNEYEWEKGQLYPTMMIDEAIDVNNISCTVIDENGDERKEICNLVNPETIDEQRTQYEVKYGNDILTKVIVQIEDKDDSVINYDHLIHFIADKGVQEVDEIKFENGNYTSFIYKNQQYCYSVDDDFIKLLNRYDFADVNELYKLLLNNIDEYYWVKEKGQDIQSNNFVIESDEEVLDRRRNILKLFKAIFDSDIKANTQQLDEYHEAIISYLEYFIDIISTKPYLVKLDVIEIENTRIITPFAPINLAFYLMCWDKFCIQDELDKIKLKSILKKVDNSELFKYIKGNDNWFVSKRSPAFLWSYYREEGGINNYGDEKYISTVIKNNIKKLKSIYPYLFQIKKQTIQIGVVNPGDAKFALKGLLEYFYEIKKELDTYESETHFHISLLYEKDDDMFSYCAFDEVFEKKVFDQMEEIIIRYVSYSKDSLKKVTDKSNVFFHILFVKDIFKVDSNFSNMYLQEHEYLNTYFSNGLNCHPLTKSQHYANCVTYTSYNNYDTLIDKNDLSLFEKLLSETHKHYTKAFATGLLNNINTHPLRTVSVTTENIPFDLFDIAFIVTFLDREIDIDIFNSENITEKQKPFLIDYSNFNNKGNNESDIKFLTITNQREPFIQTFKHALKEYTLLNTENIILSSLFKDINILNGFWVLELLNSRENINKTKGILGTIAAFRFLKDELQKDDFNWHFIISIEEFIGIDAKYKQDIASRFEDRSEQKYCDDLAIVTFSKNLNESDNIELKIKLVEVKNSSKADYVKKGFIQLQETEELLNKLFIKVNKFTSSLRSKEIINLLLYNRNKYSIFDSEYLHLEKDWSDAFSHDLRFLIDQINHNKVELVIEPGTLININASDDTIDDIEIEAPENIEYIPIKENEFIKLISLMELENKKFKYVSKKREQEKKNERQNEKLNEDEEMETDEQESANDTKSDEDNEKIDARKIASETDKSSTSTNIYDDVSGEDHDIIQQIKVSDDSKVFCGRRITSSNELIFYDPKRQGNNLSNMNVMITGSPGRGKTQLLKSMIIQQRKKNVNFLIFDFKNDFGDEEFLKLADLEYINLEIEGLPYNPLIPPIKTDRNIKYMNFEAHVHAITGVFEAVYGIQVQQSASLKKVIRDTYTKSGININNRKIEPNSSLYFPVLDEIREDFLEENPNAYARLDPIFSYGLFKGEFRQVNLTSLLNKSYVFNLSSIANDKIKNAIAKILVVSSHQYLNTLEHSQKIKNVFVFDEAHRFLGEPKLESLVRECRAYGLAIWLSSQYPSDYPDSISPALETKIIHGNGDDETQVRTIKKLVGFDGADEKIKKLGLFDAIFSNYHYRKAFIKTLSYPHALILIEAYKHKQINEVIAISGVESVRLGEMIQHLVTMGLLTEKEQGKYVLTESGNEVAKYLL